MHWRNRRRIRRRASGRSVYNYSRDYDPQVGRYIESDPIGLAGGSYSTYAYADGNPVSNIDSTGEFSVSPAVIEQALGRAGLAEAAGLGPEDPFADVAAAIAIVATIATASDSPAPSASAAGNGCGPNDPCKGLRDQLAAHQQKLQDYISNPSAYDNNGFLGQGRDAAVVSGRVRSLQKQIDNFRKLLAECEAQHGRGT
jgi:RHS repeat-associated protein